MSDQNQMPDLRQINVGITTIGERRAMTELIKMAVLQPDHPPIVVLYDGNGNFTTDPRAQGQGYEVWVMTGNRLISYHGVESNDAMASATMSALSILAARHQIKVDKSMENGSFFEATANAMGVQPGIGDAPKGPCMGMVKAAVDLQHGRKWSECEACGKTYAPGKIGLCHQVSAPKKRS